MKKNNAVLATFTFDADGKRVKSIMGAETILFVGAHYEIKNGSEITKYYMAGSTRVAMRKYTIPQNMTVEYMLSDHLGSTSLTTDANGAKVLELRYKAWGEVRASWTANPTTTPAYKPPAYTYTGQYSYMDDPTTSGVTEGFGLMFYNARWYDPALGRFAQADTVISGGAQGYDRYAYVNNNPVNGTDPTGHQTDEGDGGNYTWQDRLHDATLIKKDYHDLCERGYDQYCSEPDIFIKHHPKPVTGIFWQYSGQAGWMIEGGVTYQTSYVIDWKTGTVYKVITTGSFVYGGSPTGIEGDVSFGTQNYHGIPNDVEDITGFLEGTAQDTAVSGNLDMGLLAGAEQNVSVNLNETGGAMYTHGAGYSYTTEQSIEFGGNAAPNGFDFNLQTGKSLSFVVGVWHLW